MGILEFRMGAIAKGLEEHGFQRTVWTKEGSLSPGESAKFSFEKPAEKQILLIALGHAPTTDLDLVALRPDGEIAAQDETAERRASLQLVPAMGESLKVRVTASEGGGPFYVAGFEAEAGTPPPPMVQIMALDPVGTTSTENAIQFARQSGFTELEVQHQTSLTRGESIREPFFLHRHKCYLISALGSGGLDSVQLRLQTGDKKITDTTRRRDGWIRSCPQRDEETVLVAKALAGSGEVRVMVFSGRRDRVIPPPLPHLGAPPKKDELPSLAQRLDESMKERGYEPGEILAQGIFDDVEPDELELSLAGGTCFAVSLLTTANAPDAYLEPRSSKARASRRDLSTESNGSFPVCTTEDLKIPMAVRAGGGKGPWRVILNTLANIRLPIPDPPLSIREAAAKLVGASLTKTSEVRLRKGRSPKVLTANILLEGGRCHAVAVGTNRLLLESLALYAEGESKPLSSRSGPTNILMVAACPNKKTWAKIVVGVQGESDEKPRALLFSSEDPSPPRSFDDMIP